MRRRSRLSSLCAIAATAAGCGDGATRDPGIGLPLRVQGAQLVLAPIPQPSGGPAVTFLDMPQSRVHAGEARVPLGGRTGPSGFAVHLGLADRAEHWVLPVGLPDSVAIEELTWAARLDFAQTLASGATAVRIAAVDGQGRAGEASTAQFMITGDAPEGALVVTLEWDRDVDLDLHVVLPDGTAIGPKNINAYEPPPPGRPPPPPDAWMAGGRIDFDSNPGCVIDGRRRERATWATAPAGSYQVYVDLARSCGQPQVSFRVNAHQAGAEVATAGGTLYAFDASMHAEGGAPGLFVFALEVQ